MAENENEIYELHVMRHYDEPYHHGHLADATHTQRVDNPVCGDSVQLELKLSEDGLIAEAWFTAAGCIISQAAASILVEHIEGMTVVEARNLTARDTLSLFRARLTVRRQQCCLLAWQALMGLIAALDESS